jgi:hypothetical protein
MKRLWIVLMLSFLLLGRAQKTTAKPELKLDSLNVLQGGTVFLNLNLSEGLEPYAGVNAKILLPEDITITGVSRGELLSEDFIIDWNSMYKSEGNYINVIAYSGTNTFNSSNGTLLKIGIQADFHTPFDNHPIQFANGSTGLSNFDGSITVSHSISDGFIKYIDPTEDLDGDGLSNEQEFSQGTDPTKMDTDSDGISDGWEVKKGLDPLLNDSIEDLDEDGYTNLEEYKGGTNPQDSNEHPTRPYIIENDCHPFPGQGILTDSRIPVDTSVVIRLKGDPGIDTNSVVMALNENTIIPVFKQVNENNKDYWIIYHPENTFYFDQIVTIAVDAANTSGINLGTYEYSFKVESQEENNNAMDNWPSSTIDESSQTQHSLIAESGTEIEGAMILYDPTEPVKPRFGPTNELPPLDIANAIGIPIALEPPTVFNNPVTVFIPCPGVDDLSSLNVYYYNPAVGWISASQADGWMVPDSRKNHPETFIPTIEIQANHFSGVQAGIPSNSANVNDESNSANISTEGGSTSCFIESIIH